MLIAAVLPINAPIPNATKIALLMVPPVSPLGRAKDSRDRIGSHDRCALNYRSVSLAEGHFPDATDSRVGTLLQNAGPAAAAQDSGTAAQEVDKKEDGNR